MAFLVALLAIAGALTRALTNGRALNRRLYNNLVASGGRDNRYINVLRVYADLRRLIDKRPICPEPPFQDDCINILVVDSDDEGALKTASRVLGFAESSVERASPASESDLSGRKVAGLLTVAMHTAFWLRTRT